MVALRAEPDRQLQCKLLVELRLDYHSALCLKTTHPGPKHVGPSASIGVATHHHGSGSNRAMVEFLILDPDLHYFVAHGGSPLSSNSAHWKKVQLLDSVR